MNSSTTVEHSVALGAEQKSIWCYSGIDLYVSLRIDETESACVDSLSPWGGSDAPRHSQPFTRPLVTPPADVIARTLYNGERSSQREISLEASTARSRIVEKTCPLEASAARPRIVEKTCPHFAPSELDKLDGEGRALAQTRGEQICGQGKQFGPVEARRRCLPGVAVRRFIARFVAPLAVQSDEPRCLHNSAQTSSGDLQSQEGEAGERSSEDDHEKVCDLEGQCRPSKYDLSSRSRNVVKGCRYSAINDDLGEIRGRQEDLEDRPKDQTLRNEASNSCNENRSWSPDIEDYSWVSRHMSRDVDTRLTGYSEGITDVGEELDQDWHDVPSSFMSEKDVAGRMFLHDHSGNPSLDTFIPSKFPGIESFDVAEILAACQLVKMSAFDCGKDFSHQHLSGTTGYDVNKLEFRGESSEGLSTMIGTMYGSLHNVDVDNSKHSSQPRVGKLDLSPWSDEDRYIPRVARRARGRPRGSQFSTRIDFGNTEVDDDSDCEISQQPPRKRQYKSTQELLLA